MAEWVVTVGDCRDVLAGLESESVDAVVCDPPYELSFMGKGWDGTGIAYDVAMWGEVLRVLKPGGHLLAFGGTRTFHRMTVAIEDAGFEVRDCLSWLYATGFPKSLNVSKAIDKVNGEAGRSFKFTKWMQTTGVTARQLNDATGTQMGNHYTTHPTQPAIPTAELWTVIRSLCGEVPGWVDELVARVEAEREVVGTKMSGIANKAEGPRHTIGASKAVEVDVTLAATPEAARWEGWGTALKPAWEPIVMARKPLIGTVAGNVLAHGTGGLNIDGSRIGTNGGTRLDPTEPDTALYAPGTGELTRGDGDAVPGMGRWPANVLLDEGAAAALDEQTGVTGTGKRVVGKVTGTTFGSAAPMPDDLTGVLSYGDKGGASRFFYVAKASRRDRNEGLDGMEERDGAGSYEFRVDGSLDGKPTDKRANFHPTVKPTALMRHLVRLVTPPGGLVLDPFTGSGSTGKAAVLEGFRFHGIEQDAEYAEIARARIAWAEQQLDSEQPTLM